MTDHLPLWFWLPVGVCLWGWMALDAIVRRCRPLRLAVIDPPRVGLHRPEDGQPDHPVSQQGHQQQPEDRQNDDEQQHRSRDIHMTEASGSR